MKVAVVGVTGLVGSVMCEVLEERNFPVTEFLPTASERVLGKEITFREKKYPVMGLEAAVAARPDIALFSAGAAVSREWAPRFAAAGTRVIDNSSAWRMDPGIKLVVPEVNTHALEKQDLIIANPNCSTIQMVVALAPLHKRYTIERLVVSTYQSITGTGMRAVEQYSLEKKGYVPAPEEMAYKYQIFENCIPHCDIFLENDYTKEEMKLVNETRKIMEAPEIRITATAVRVPVLGGHSESVNIEFARDFEVAEVRQLLAGSPGIILLDDPAQFQYPMPLLSKNRDESIVGRIRRDESAPRALNIWVVSDNLRKGAATNAVQYAEALRYKGFV